MSFTVGTFVRVAGAGGHAPAIYCYSTLDTAADCEVEGYFDEVAALLRTGDVITGYFDRGGTPAFGQLGVTVTDGVVTAELISSGAAPSGGDTFTVIPQGSRIYYDTWTDGAVYDTISNATLVGAEAKYALVSILADITLATGSGSAEDEAVLSAVARATGSGETADFTNDLLVDCSAVRQVNNVKNDVRVGFRAIVACGTSATSTSGNYTTIAGQTEADFDGVGDNGTFYGDDGGWNALDTITLLDGTIVRVDAVDGGGVVTEFTITTGSTSPGSTTVLTDGVHNFELDLGVANATRDPDTGKFDIALSTSSVTGSSFYLAITPIGYWA